MPVRSVTPFLATGLPDRAHDGQTAGRIADLEKKQDWSALAGLAKQLSAAEPEESDWLMLLGYAQLRMAQYPIAAQTFGKMLKRSPEDIDGWNMLGEAQRRDGQPAKAVQTLEYATRIDPTSHVTRYLLAEALRAERRFEPAKASYREALRLEPRFPPALLGLGEALIATGAVEELQKVSEQLRALDPALARELDSKRMRTK